MGKLTNLIKAFEQRLQAAAKKQQAAQQQNGNGSQGEVMAKVLPAIIGAKVKGKIKEKEADQKMRHKDAQFAQQLHHEAIKTRADIAKTDLTTAAEIKRKRTMFDEEPDDQN